jgi:hypothetical protein
MLRQKLNAVLQDNDDVESRHWLASELCQLLEGCGIAEDLVMSSLNRLYERRLVEAFDPNAARIGIADRVLIKESGMAHLEMLLTSTVYVEQMALVTGVSELSARDDMKKQLPPDGRMDILREAFLRYVLKIDRGRMGIPPKAVYSQLEMARTQIERLIAPRGKPRAAV